MLEMPRTSLKIWIYLKQALSIKARLSGPKIVVAVLALLAIATGLFQLELGRSMDGVSIRHEQVGSIPVTLFRPVRLPAPTVVIAHGFAGSQQLMQAFALTLARNGYLAVTFDFPGHGHNPTPLPGDLLDQESFSQALLAALGQVCEFAGKSADSDGRLALLGHSMASEIVVRYAQSHGDVAATIAVSLFSPSATATSPRNLLIIDGALEPAMLRDQAYRIVELAAQGPALERVTYGNFAAGTARRLALPGGVEHIGVLFSRVSMEEALSWLNAVFQRSSSIAVDTPGIWLGLLYLGLIGLAWPLAALLPRAAATPAGASLPWRPLLAIAIVPALSTPLILWKLQTAFLPILLGDYLVLHFGLYGLLTAAGLYLSRLRRTAPAPESVQGYAGGLAIAAAAMAAYGIVALGAPIDRYLTSFLPGSWRLPLILAMLAGTLPYFLADECLTRGAGARRGAYAISKLCFLVSLALAVALNLQKLFFLIIIVPVILLLFVVFGLFSGWAYRTTWNPLVAASANALVFAWSMAVVFPLVRH